MVIQMALWALIFAVVMFLLAELCAYIYIWTCPAEFASGLNLFRIKLPAYKGALFFCAKFSEEVCECVKLNYDKYEAYGYFGLEDFRGEFINVKNGVRLTTKKPENPDNTVWLFGSSSVFSRRTPDNETIASHLQILLNDHFGDRFSVENKGIPHMAIWEQVNYLRDTKISPGDVVIFFNGVSEANRRLFHSLKSSAQIRSPECLSRLRSLNRSQRVINKLYQKQKDRISLVRVFLDVFRRTPPVSMTDDQLVLKNLASLKTDFYEATVLAHEWCLESGAMFCLTLQPHLFMVKNPTRWEKKLMRSHRLVRPGIRESIERGYKAFDGIARELREKNIFVAESSDLFENRPHGVEYFFDQCHINHEGARVMAWKFFKIVSAAQDRMANLRS